MPVGRAGEGPGRHAGVAGTSPRDRTHLVPARPKLSASAFLVVTLATACGGRPSVDELSDAMQDNASEVFGDDVPDDAIDWDCMAKAYHDSDISDEALRAMVDGDEDYDASDDDKKALTEVGTSAGDCVEMPSS